MDSNKFNSYIDCPSIDYWKELLENEGTLKHFDRNDSFFREGEVAKYIGYIKSGTLKYATYDSEGSEHILGLEFAGEFVADFPFSIYGKKARLSVIASSSCDILCFPTRIIQERLSSDDRLLSVMMKTTEAVFDMTYNRYKDLYTKSPQQRYNDLISKHPDLFSLFSLRDIASFLKITPTHLSRLRRNI